MQILVLLITLMFANISLASENFLEIVKEWSDADFEYTRINNPEKFRINCNKQLEIINSKYLDIFRGIMFAESTSGKFRIHKHAGVSRALGSFGLIPTNSIADVALRSNTQLEKQFPEYYSNIKKYIKNKEWIEVSKYTLDYKIEAVIVNDYIKILERYLNNRDYNRDIHMEIFILSWKLGVGGAMKIYRTGEENVINHFYVKRVLSNM